MLTVKVNPVSFSSSPSVILKYFPNINTMVVECISCFNERNTLPDSVTSLILKLLDLTKLTDSNLRYADRVVEIRRCSFDRDHPADFSLFPNLERLTFDK